jgi:hypothetical protein
VSTVTDILQAKVNPAVTFRTVETEMRQRNYGVVSTVARNGRPHSTSVAYALSARSRPLALYIVRDRRSKKARNIDRNPNVAFVVPVPRSPGFLPPAPSNFRPRQRLFLTRDVAALARPGRQAGCRPPPMAKI